MNIPSIVLALNLIRPNAEWNLKGDSYEGLIWLDGSQTKPTQEELDNAVLKIKTESEIFLYNKSLLTQIEKLETRQSRAVRDALLTGDITRIQTIENEIATLRYKLRKN